MINHHSASFPSIADHSIIKHVDINHSEAVKARFIIHHHYSPSSFPTIHPPLLAMVSYPSVATLSHDHHPLAATFRSPTLLTPQECCEAIQREAGAPWGRIEIGLAVDPQSWWFVGYIWSININDDGYHYLTSSYSVEIHVLQK